MNTEGLGQHRKPEVFDSDLSEQRYHHYARKSLLAVDTETRGLNIQRDRLCLVQLCDDEGYVSLVKFHGQPANRLKQLLESTSLVKVIHYARFDVSVLKHYLQAQTAPIFCTKIASKLVRTYTDKHSLKELGRELLGLQLDKADQTSDWARDDLTDSQLEYAANDVRVLIPIYKQLKMMLEREDRDKLHQKVCEFIPVVVQLDLLGFKDIFEH